MSKSDGPDRGDQILTMIATGVLIACMVTMIILFLKEGS